MKRKTRKILIGAAGTLAVVALAAIGTGSAYMVHFALGSKRVSTQKFWDNITNGTPEVARPWLDSVRTTNALHDVEATVRGHRMHALVINADRPTAKTAVVVHGYNDCSISMLHIAYIYHHLLGYNVLLPDLYGHGKSEGNAIGMGWPDRLDVMEWIKIADRMWSRSAGEPSQIVVHGISMGAATTMALGGEKLPESVKCLVEDCGYTSVWDEFSKEMRSNFDMPEFPMLYSSSLLCKALYGWSFGEASPLKQVAKCKLPMLFIHGDNDTYVPTAMVYPLYEAKSEPKELYIAKGSKHARSFKDHPEEYSQHVTQFVSRFIK